MRFESAVPLGGRITEWLSHQVSPITWDGPQEAVLMVSTVITERKWLEENLRDSEEQYRAIVTASGDGILIMDPEGRITFVSPRVYEILEVPVDEPLTGKDALEFIDPVCQIIARTRMTAILAGDLDAEPFAYILLSRQGNRFRGELVTTPLHDAGGAISGLLVLIRDISRRSAGPTPSPAGIAGKKYPAGE